jgi:cellobiose phosphorylase
MYHFYDVRTNRWYSERLTSSLSASKIYIINRLHVTSWSPCWKTLTKYFSLASFVYGTNMAAMSLSSHSLENDCEPRIDKSMPARHSG